MTVVLALVAVAAAVVAVVFWNKARDAGADAAKSEAELAQARSASADQKKQLDAARAEIANYKKQLADSQAAAARHQSEASNANTAMARLKEQLEQARMAADRAKAKADADGAQARSLQSELEGKVKAQTSEVRKLLARLKEMEGAKAGTARLQTELAAAKTQVVELQGRLDSIAAQTATAKNHRPNPHGHVLLLDKFPE